MAEGDRVEKRITIQNKKGLHARAATMFVQAAAKFPCEITLAKDGPEVNGKSILSLLTLVAPYGTKITLRAKGERAAEAIAALSALVDSKFGED